MAGSMSKMAQAAAVEAEASRQAGADSAPPEAEDFEHFSTEKVGQLASAVGYIAEQMKLADQGNIQMPGTGPQALKTLPATSSEKNIDAGEGGQATAAHVVPKNPKTQKEEVQVGKANTGLQTNDEANQPEQPKDPWSNEKATLQNDFTRQPDATKTSAALLQGNYARLMKIGQPVAPEVELVRSKLAEDKIYPAKIQAKHQDVPPAATPAEKGKVPVPKDVRAQQKLVGSNQAAIDYNKGQAKADPKSDLNKVLTEPALSAAHDKVLQKTLDHTSEAGVKISMAQDANRVAAARALMSNLLKEAAESCPSGSKDKAKKEKESMMGAAPSVPQQISNPIQ
jgi:hypothetical protein